MSRTKYQYSYDADFDVFTLQELSVYPTYGVEAGDDIVALHKIFTGDLCGMRIYDFKFRLSRGQLRLAELPVPLNRRMKKVREVIGDV